MGNTLQPLGRLEFILLMAALSALDAFSIDAMIPALAQISSDLDIVVDNHRQFIITAIFIGFAAGVLIYGFVADRYGRRRPVLVGFCIYSVGSLLCITADSLSTLMIGRVLQGLGAAGPYILSIAIVRDLYHGRDMSQILSLIMMVFIGVPMIAPFVGQGVMLLAGWRSIFGVLAVYSVVTLIWFWSRQPETLLPKHRQPLTLNKVKHSITEVLSNRQTLRYLFAMAAIFGAFMAYLSTAQQILQGMYGLNTSFPLVFACLASLFGIGSFFNSRWVHSIGSARLIHWALSAIVVASSLYLSTGLITELLPPLWFHLGYLSIVMFCMALLFGNTMSLALEPMGHIAGSASSVVNSMSTFIAIGISTFFGSQISSSAYPVATGFALMSAVALLLNFPNLGKRSTTS